ncbi:MAG: hypothetical protein IJK87_08705 [Prevotella sp.]|nr:hypothetical protein [Prevotella sp.]
MASVGGGCGISRVRMWHLWGADAAQNMLKSGIYGARMMNRNGKSLAFSML